MTMSSKRKVLVNSMPKSGTNLLANIIDLCGYRNVNTVKKWQRLLIGPPNSLSHEGVRNTPFWRFYHFGGWNHPNNSVLIGVGSPIQVSADLFQKWLESVPDGYYILGHLPWLPLTNQILDKMGYKHTLIIRDPRDILISMLHHVLKPTHALDKDFNFLSEEARLLMTIEGGILPKSGRQFYGVLPAMKNVLAWQQSEQILMVRFEDLIGEKGGGSKELQLSTVGKIRSFLGFPIDDTITRRICDRAFDNKSPTFRKGQIGGWKEELSPEHLRLFNNKCGDLLHRLGYPV